MTGSLVPAVFAAADNAITSLLMIATTTGSPFEKHKPDELGFEGGRVYVKANGSTGGVPFAGVLVVALAAQGLNIGRVALTSVGLYTAAGEVR